jgi:hypothetical protein
MRLEGQDGTGSVKFAGKGTRMLDHHTMSAMKPIEIADRDHRPGETQWRGCRIIGNNKVPGCGRIVQVEQNQGRPRRS